ncbi:hypothetical protein LJR005_001149 [Rossellomorea sp. LjRoot5]
MNKTIVIIGAGKGISFETALQLYSICRLKGPLRLCTKKHDR